MERKAAGVSVWIDEGLRGRKIFRGDVNEARNVREECREDPGTAESSAAAFRYSPPNRVRTA